MELKKMSTKKLEKLLASEKKKNEWLEERRDIVRRYLAFNKLNFYAVEHRAMTAYEQRRAPYGKVLWDPFSSYDGRKRDDSYSMLHHRSDYDEKWKGTFFDTEKELIVNDLYTTHPDLIREKGRPMRLRYLYSPLSYEGANDFATVGFQVVEKEFLDNIRQMYTYENKPDGYFFCDHDVYYIGYCDSVTEEDDGAYRIHLVDPYGSCTSMPIRVSKEVIEQAFGKICILASFSNVLLEEQIFKELQILPYTLREKIGNHGKDTVVIQA